MGQRTGKGKNAKGGTSRFFSERLYSFEAVKLAAAVFSGRARIPVSRSGGGTLVRFPPVPGLEGEFCNEALNQQCRIDLAAANSGLTGMIVMKALLSASGAAAGGSGAR